MSQKHIIYGVVGIFVVSLAVLPMLICEQERSNPHYSQARIMINQLKIADAMYKVDYREPASSLINLLPSYLDLQSIMIKEDTKKSSFLFLLI